MKIHIFHYHLHPGGVTRIVQSQAAGLREAAPAAEIHIHVGQCDEPEAFEKTGAKVHVYSSLNYLTEDDARNIELKKRYQEILSYLKENVDSNDILHFHNLNLGKNPLVTLAVSELIQVGYHVFNHCHDFAEDRPGNWAFLEEIISKKFGQELIPALYPVKSNCFYGVLNSKDHQRLDDYHIPEKNTMWLPNPVGATGVVILDDPKATRNKIAKTLGLDPEKLITTYPVRVIRRKNIGEFILLAELFKDRSSWLVTLAPKNPVEVEPYEQWKQFCREQNIRVVFEAGTHVDFEELLASSDFAITTSKQEGFGLVYMEPWLMNTPVVGRKIPYIIKDLEEDGIKFPALYEKVSIPGYNNDYKDLDDESQKAIIRKARDDKEFRTNILSHNSILDKLLEKPGQDIITHNQQIILQNYSVKHYGERLYEIYKSFA